MAAALLMVGGYVRETVVLTVLFGVRSELQCSSDHPQGVYGGVVDASGTNKCYQQLY